MRIMDNNDEQLMWVVTLRSDLNVGEAITSHMYRWSCSLNIKITVTRILIMLSGLRIVYK